MVTSRELRLLLAANLLPSLSHPHVGTTCCEKRAIAHLAEVLQWLREVQNDEHDLDFSRRISR